MTYISGGTLAGVLRLSQPAVAPGLAAAGTGRIYYDSTDNKFKVSENGGAYVDLAGGATPALEDVLAVGNTTGANNIVVTAGQEITSTGDLILSSAPGNFANLYAGNATTPNGSSGGIFFYSGDGDGTGASGDLNFEIGVTGAGGNIGGYYFIQPAPAGGVAGPFDVSLNGGNFNIQLNDAGGDANLLGFANLSIGLQSTLGSPMIEVSNDSSMFLRAGNNSQMTLVVTGSTATMNLHAANMNIGADGAFNYLVNIGSGAGGVTVGDGTFGSVFTVNTETVNIPQINGSTTAIYLNETPDPDPSYPAGMWVLAPVGEAIYLGAGTILVEGDGTNNRIRGKFGATGSGAAGEQLWLAGGAGDGAAAGGLLRLESGAGGATGNGGAINMTSGAGGTTSGNSGALSIDAGAVTSGTTGTISVGATNASAVTVGRAGITSTIAGVTDLTGATNLGAIATVSGNTTLDATYSNVLVDASGGPVTLTLPAAASSTRRVYTIKKIDSSVNSVVIDGNGAETIDGAATVSLVTQYESLRIVCNGTSWFIM